LHSDNKKPGRIFYVTGSVGFRNRSSTVPIYNITFYRYWVKRFLKITVLPEKSNLWRFK